MSLTPPPYQLEDQTGALKVLESTVSSLLWGGGGFGIMAAGGGSIDVGALPMYSCHSAASTAVAPSSASKRERARGASMDDDDDYGADSDHGHDGKRHDASQGSWTARTTMARSGFDARDATNQEEESPVIETSARPDSSGLHDDDDEDDGAADGEETTLSAGVDEELDELEDGDLGDDPDVSLARLLLDDDSQLGPQSFGDGSDGTPAAAIAGAGPAKGDPPQLQAPPPQRDGRSEEPGDEKGREPDDTGHSGVAARESRSNSDTYTLSVMESKDDSAAPAEATAEMVISPLKGEKVVSPAHGGPRSAAPAFSSPGTSLSPANSSTSTRRERERDDDDDYDRANSDTPHPSPKNHKGATVVAVDMSVGVAVHAPQDTAAAIDAAARAISAAATIGVQGLGGESGAEGKHESLEGPGLDLDVLALRQRASALEQELERRREARRKEAASR